MLLVPRDADAAIGDREPDLFASLAPAPVTQAQDHRALAREFHRIGEEIEDHLADPGLVADESARQARIDRGADLKALRDRVAAHDREAIVDERCRSEGVTVELDPARLDLREIENVVHDGEQGRAGQARHLGMASQVGRKTARSREEVGESDDGVERRADLVAHRGQEFGLRRARSFRMKAGRFGRRLGVPQRQFGVLALRDIEVHADHTPGIAGIVVIGAADREEPAPTAIRQLHPIFRLEDLARRDRLLDACDGRDGIIRLNERLPLVDRPRRRPVLGQSE